MYRYTYTYHNLLLTPNKGTPSLHYCCYRHHLVLTCAHPDDSSMAHHNYIGTPSLDYSNKAAVDLLVGMPIHDTDGNPILDGYLFDGAAVYNVRIRKNGKKGGLFNSFFFELFFFFFFGLGKLMVHAEERSRFLLSSLSIDTCCACLRAIHMYHPPLPYISHLLLLFTSFFLNITLLQYAAAPSRTYIYVCVCVYVCMYVSVLAD